MMRARDPQLTESLSRCYSRHSHDKLTLRTPVESEMNKRIVLWSPLDDYLAGILGALSEIDYVRVNSEAELAGELPAADALVLPGVLYSASVAKLIRERANRLDWIQLTTAGFDGIILHGVPASIVVTNAGKVHGPLIAEHALTLLTAATRRLPLFLAHQSNNQWNRKIALPLTTLEDAAVAVLGFGSIGREIAKRLKAFGARVIAIDRTIWSDELADEFLASSQLHDALSKADALVVAASLTPESKGLIDGAAINSLRRGSILVNVGRGAIVDTMAVANALNEGRLAGAALDVTDPEPLPSDHPLWSCPNAIITPHVSPFGSPAVRRRYSELLRDNITRFLAGEQLAHRVA